jgi:acyl-CoA synthetase (AMP-forming)/AMP-acid ligase II
MARPEYVLWGGRELRPEVRNLVALLRGGASLVLHPAPVEGASWLGDEGIAPVGFDGDGSLTLYTSGTTGVPKRVQKVLDLSPSSAPAGRWLLSYSPFRWAGISVIAHVLRTGSDLVVPESLQPDELVRAASAERATHVSLSPSTFKRILIGTDESLLRALPLEQITFGGEAAPQGALDAARRLWPSARVTHVLASTELGDVCAVSDGLAGIPASKLFRGGLYVDPETGELIANGRGTGDFWRLEEGRYHFVGRGEEIINVGGEKVSPLLVEEAAMAVDGVTAARAFAVPSALTGSLVGLEYSGAATEADVRLALRGSLPKVAQPRQVRRVESIGLTDAGKLRRAA